MPCSRHWAYKTQCSRIDFFGCALLRAAATVKAFYSQSIIRRSKKSNEYNYIVKQTCVCDAYLWHLLIDFNNFFHRYNHHKWSAHVSSVRYTISPWLPWRTIIMPPPLIGGGIKRRCCMTSVCLTSVAYIGPKSRTERPRKTKIGTEVANVTRDSDTTFKVKGHDHQAERESAGTQRSLLVPARLLVDACDASNGWTYNLE